MYKRHFALLVAALTATPALLPAAPHLSVQVGAYRTVEEANTQSERAKSSGADSIEIRKEETGDKGIFYKVLVGNFSSRDDAEAAKETLAENGLKGFIRVNASLDLGDVTAAIENGTADYFTTGTVVESLAVDKSLPENFGNIRAAALAGPTTAPETLQAIGAYISQIPDTNPGKAKEINMLGHRTMSGKSAQNSYPDSAFEPARSLMMQVANGEIAVRKQEQAEARAMISHLLHYYDHDHINALRAYRQVFQDQVAIGNLVAASKSNSEIAATCFELAKKSNYEMEQFVVHAAELWGKANELTKEARGKLTEKSADRVDFFGAKVGLILTEAYLENKDWEHANQMADSLIEINSENHLSLGLVAESWCHKAHALAELKRYEEANKSADRAIKIAKEFGPVWGDKLIDPYAKGYAWKYNIAQMQNKFEDRDRIAAEIRSTFPDGHPTRSKYGQLDKGDHK